MFKLLIVQCCAAGRVWLSWQRLSSPDELCWELTLRMEGGAALERCLFSGLDSGSEASVVLADKQLSCCQGSQLQLRFRHYTVQDLQLLCTFICHVRSVKGSLVFLLLLLHFLLNQRLQILCSHDFIWFIEFLLTWFSLPLLFFSGVLRSINPPDFIWFCVKGVQGFC